MAFSYAVIRRDLNGWHVGVNDYTHLSDWRWVMKATDEEVALWKEWHSPIPDPYGGMKDMKCSMCHRRWPCSTAKLLARLERVESELSQTEKECENALAALAGEPYPYPEIKLRK